MVDIQQIGDIGVYIAESLGDSVISYHVSKDELTLNTSAKTIAKTLTFLRDDMNCQFKQLIDVCGVDFPEREKRFDIVYHLLSMPQNTRVRVCIQTDETTPVPSVCDVFSSASWFEREAWDLYGIFFSGHPDLRRILTDYGFEGHPLRKDFPLTGYVEVRYDDEQKRVVYEPVNLTQEYRSFDFLSPWEGMQGQLPGDEKAEVDQTKEDTGDA